MYKIRKLFWVTFLLGEKLLFSAELELIQQPVSSQITAHNNVVYTTLNFNYKDTLVSGICGTIETWTPFKTKVAQRNYFDVDGIHALLAAHTRHYENKSKNGVVAAFTVIIKNTSTLSNTSQYYAITKLIMEENKGCRLWPSGELSSKKDHEKRLFFEHLNKRIAALKSVCKSESELVKLVEQICKHQKKFFDAFIHNIRELLDTQNSESLNSIVDLWEKVRIAREKAEVPYLQESPQENTDSTMLGSLFETQDSSDTEDSSGPDELGPFVDSEQFLLSYLEQNFIAENTEIERLAERPKKSRGVGEMHELSTKVKMDDFVKTMQNKLTEELAKNLKEIANNTKSADRTIPADQVQIYTRLLKEFDCFFDSAKAFEPVGCILHVHSTYELCEYCAASFVCEFHKRQDDNFVNRCKTYMGAKNPGCFFVAFASYGKELSGGLNHWRLPGTVSGKKCREATGKDYINSHLNLENVINEATLPLLNIEKITSSANPLNASEMAGKTLEGLFIGSFT